MVATSPTSGADDFDVWVRDAQRAWLSAGEIRSKLKDRQELIQ
jgi:hypothetical protein